MESDPEEIVDIYRQRWEIELLFKQMKQNFPLKYFYGESTEVHPYDSPDFATPSYCPIPRRQKKRMTAHLQPLSVMGRRLGVTFAGSLPPWLFQDPCPSSAL
ncbi:MAG: transposase [Lepagella sp.]